MLFLYFDKGLIFFKMSVDISIYLFQILVDIGLTLVFQEFRGLFCRMKELLGSLSSSSLSYKCLWIKLAPSSIISFNSRLFRIELPPYSHNIFFRLFVPLIEINPVFLLSSLCISTSLVLGISSFYYEYSYLSIFAKVHM